MELVEFQLKGNGWEWLTFSLPITRAEVEAMRKAWRAWLKEHNAASIEDASSSNGTCLRLIDTEATRKWNGFDRLILARLVIAKSVRWSKP